MSSSFLAGGSKAFSSSFNTSGTPKGSPLGISAHSTVSSNEATMPLFQAFQQFALCSTSVSSPGDIIDGTHFQRFLRVAGICDGKGFSVVDGDILFNKLKEKGERYLTWQTFVAHGIPEIASRRRVSSDVIKSQLSEASPYMTPNRQVRLHDDRRSYTGTVRHGGPTTVEKTPKNLATVVDRRMPSDVRGALI